jgi:hypothetical protein
MELPGEDRLMRDGLAGQQPAPVVSAPGNGSTERRSHGREGRPAGIAAPAGGDPDRHRGEHALHAGPHVMDSDRLDLVVPQEPCDPSVVGTLGPLVMQRSPADTELLPIADLAAGHLGDCHTVGSSPTWVNLAIGGDRHTHFHLKGLLAAMRQALALAVPPDTDRTSYGSMPGTSPPTSAHDLRLDSVLPMSR